MNKYYNFAQEIESPDYSEVTHIPVSYLNEKSLFTFQPIRAQTYLRDIMWDITQIKKITWNTFHICMSRSIFLTSLRFKVLTVIFKKKIHTILL